MCIDPSGGASKPPPFRSISCQSVPSNSRLGNYIVINPSFERLSFSSFLEYGVPIRDNFGPFVHAQPIFIFRTLVSLFCWKQPCLRSVSETAYLLNTYTYMALVFSVVERLLLNSSFIAQYLFHDILISRSASLSLYDLKDINFYYVQIEYSSKVYVWPWLYKVMNRFYGKAFILITLEL